MGCDGGTIPRRDELVKVKRKPEAKDKHSELVFQWQYCFLTQQLLQYPIVMCGLGHLYNKLSLIESLLNKDSLPESISHIKNLKDVKDLRLTPNPEYVPNNDKKEGKTEVGDAPYICPVIGLEMSGKFRFVGLWSCGCVFSERALKQISVNICHKCQSPFTADDIVILNGTEEDQVVMQKRMELRQQKSKKNKKKQVETIKCEKTVINETVVTEKCKNEDVSDGVVAGGSGINNKPIPPTSKGTSTVTTVKIGCSSTETSKDKKVSTVTHEIETSTTKPLKRSGALMELHDHKKKMKTTYSVAKDPQASDVYKSLFTSHKSEQEQVRAHWITYNPFYN